MASFHVASSQPSRRGSREAGADDTTADSLAGEPRDDGKPSPFSRLKDLFAPKPPDHQLAPEQDVDVGEERAPEASVEDAPPPAEDITVATLEGAGDETSDVIVAHPPEPMQPELMEAAPAEVKREPGEGLLRSIDRIAEAWSGASRPTADFADAPGVPTPEELVMIAGARGIEVTFAQRKLASLRGPDFPCVILDQDGGTLILLSRTMSGDFVCKTPEGPVERTLADLQSFSTGTVFFVRPKKDLLAHDASAPTEYAPPRNRGLIGAILQEIREHHRRDVVQLAIAAGASNLLLFAMPLFSMAVYDRVIPHLAMETLWALALGVTLALGVDVGLRAARLKLNDSIAISVRSTLQALYFALILLALPGTIPSLGGSLQVGLREIENVSQLMPNLMVSLVIDLPFFVLATVLLFGLAGPVALVPWAASLLAMGLQIFADFNNARIRESTRLTTTQSNILVETATARETVQTLNAGPQLLRRWERLTDATAYAGHLSRLQSSLASIAALAISQAAVVGTIILGVYQIGAGAMTIGALSAATLLIGRMMAPMSQLGMYLHRLKQVSGSVAIVENVLSANLEAAGDPSTQTRPLQGAIELRNVGFTYPGEKSPALSGITLTIRPGEHVGIIGRAGSGKSTLLKLLVRLNEIDSGAYLLDGHDARQFAPEQIRRHFAYMRQDSLPFDDTLQNVICFGLDRIDDDAFRRAVTISGVHEFASRHPSGYALRVGPRGERLSGGERQSVMLARILLGEAPAMLLDEPTSSMDNTMEMRLVADLRAVIENRTFVVATHRAALLGLVDRLVWIEQGRILADGPKAEVLKKMSGG